MFSVKFHYFKAFFFQLLLQKSASVVLHLRELFNYTSLFFFPVLITAEQFSTKHLEV